MAVDMGWEPRTALEHVADDDAGVLVLGLEELGDECWEVLPATGCQLLRVADVAAALRALSEHQARVVIADAHRARALTDALRARRERESAHVVACAALDSPREL